MSCVRCHTGTGDLAAHASALRSGAYAVVKEGARNVENAHTLRADLSVLEEGQDSAAAVGIGEEEEEFS